MDVSYGLDSVKIGVKVIFALAGEGQEAEQEEYQTLGVGRGIQKASLQMFCVYLKSMYIFLVFSRKRVSIQSVGGSLYQFCTTRPALTAKKQKREKLYHVRGNTSQNSCF